MIKKVNGVDEITAERIPPLAGESYFFSFDDPNPDILLNKFSEKMHKNLLAKAVNFKGSKVEEILLNKPQPEEVL